jgi:thiopurine S-methyltransferase
MDTADWFSRWREGRIGFHEGTPNRWLVQYAEKLGTPHNEDSTRKRVLVPLCGKTEDLMHLAKLGFEVVGVELVESAVRAFFEEHALTPQVEDHGALRSFQAAGITLWAGDFFAFGRAQLGVLSAFYDRAALVALPEELRRRYVLHLLSLLAERARGLVVSFEYDQRVMAGPPFSVSETELRGLFAGHPLELLDDHALEFRGGVRVRERCFAVQYVNDNLGVKRSP